MLNRPPHEANIAEQLEHAIDGGSLKFDYFSPNEKHRFSVFTSAANTDRDSYYGGGQDPNAYGKTTDFTVMGGTQYMYSFGRCLFMPADLTAGLEYNRDHLEDNMWGYNRHTEQTVNIYSGFLQNEWKNEKWGILLGGRLDKHNMVDHVILVLVPTCVSTRQRMLTSGSVMLRASVLRKPLMKTCILKTSVVRFL